MLVPFRASGAPSGSIVLPQNLVVNSGTLLDDCSATTGWENVLGTVALDQVTYRTGGAGLKMTSDSGSNARTRKTCSWQLYTEGGVVRVWVYLHDASMNNIWFYATSDVTFTKYFRATVPVSANWARPGWSCINLSQEDWANTGGESWDNTMLRFDISTDGTASSPLVTVDSIYDGVETVPVALFTFDDAYTSVYSNAFAFMEPLGVPGTFYVNTDLVGGALQLTTAQLVEMQTAGWSIANHTDDHTNLTTIDQETQQTRIDEARDALVSWGLTGGAHVSYPFGAYNGDTLLAMTAEAMLTGRKGTGFLPGTVMPPDDNYLLPCRDLSFFSAAQNMSYLLACKQRGEVAIILMHRPETADLQLLIDIVDYAIDQRIIPLSIEQFYQLMSGPIEVTPPW